MSMKSIFSLSTLASLLASILASLELGHIGLVGKWSPFFSQDPKCLKCITLASCGKLSNDSQMGAADMRSVGACKHFYIIYEEFLILRF